jgi:hypothetical protein
MLTDWELAGLRRRLDAGEAIDPDEQRRLIDTAAELALSAGCRPSSWFAPTVRPVRRAGRSNTLSSRSS